MTQEDRQILLKDLSSRLPYGVRYRRFAWDDKQGEECISAKIYSISPDGYVRNYHEDESDYIDNVRPYLFPFSSITEEQYIEFITISGWNCDITDIRRGKFSCISYIGLDYIYNTIDWLNKNHFDYRGLIEKGLAIDATGLNIY